MKAKPVLLFVMLALVAVPVLAQAPQWWVSLWGVCSDSDRGPRETSKPVPYVAVAGRARDRNGLVYDECVKEGIVTNTSKTIREVFCANGLVVYKDYDCTKHNYTMCVRTPRGAACVRPTCGNNRVEPGEQCDPPGMGCVTLAGMPGVCNAGCQCVPTPPPLPAKCGNKAIDPGEQCDPPGKACVVGGKPGTCDANCKCAVKKKRVCGNKIVEKPEQCDPPGKACVDVKGNPGVCTKTCKCGPKPIKPKCGDRIIQPPEQCDPPGKACRTALGLGVCTKECKCKVEYWLPVCGNKKVESGEKCDPPGSPAPQCPPVLLPDGTCGFPSCSKNCKCPAGPRCIREKKVKPEMVPTPLVGVPEKKTCDERCKEKGLQTTPVDHSQYIMDFLQGYSCVSGARIRYKGTTTLKGPGFECKCYSKELPSISVDQTLPACSTPCGPVKCGESKSCPCPDKPNCVLTASCSWNGWKWRQDRPIPIVGAKAAEKSG